MLDNVRNCTITTDPLNLPTFSPPNGTRVLANLGTCTVYGTQLAQNGDVTVWDTGSNVPKRLPSALVVPLDTSVQAAAA